MSLSGPCGFGTKLFVTHLLKCPNPKVTHTKLLFKYGMDFTVK